MVPVRPEFVTTTPKGPRGTGLGVAVGCAVADALAVGVRPGVPVDTGAAAQLPSTAPVTMVAAPAAIR